MKETGVIFSTPMALAAIELRKTITRRMRGLEHLNENPNQWAVCRQLDWLENVKGGGVQEFPGRTGSSWIALKDNLGLTDGGYYVFSCPFGEVGDRIWMRETYYPTDSPINGPIYKADFHQVESPDKSISKTAWLSDGKNGSWNGYFLGKWKPSIHMPRVACRFVAELIEIRLERLQSITEEEAELEGVHCYGEPTPGQKVFKNYLLAESEDIGVLSATYSFMTLFAMLHSQELVDLNPWVWVLKFKQV
jgi:hypothetical protein